ncbi:Transmembrane protein 94 [Halotydeus destructor]|nr:Transmembrane protein 94 [Halotydeus destructor]
MSGASGVNSEQDKTVIETGLSSLEALTKLHNDIEEKLSECACQSHGKENIRFWLSKAFSHKSLSSSFRWPSILLTIICLVIFFTCYLFSEDRSLFETAFLLIILGTNIAIVVWDTKQFHNEFHVKTTLLKDRIRKVLIENTNPAHLEAWSSGKFCPALHLPQSPCITLQWALRDSRKVNLPTSLLVKGDIIYICPGSLAPGRCRNVEPVRAFGHHNETVELNCGDIFMPMADQCPPNFTAPRLRKAVKPAKFVMLETPYMSSLTLSLNQCSSRPKSLYDKERYTIVSKYIEQIIMPIILLVVLITSSLHYGYLKLTDKDINTWANTANFVAIRPVLCILPLIPLTLPLSWLLLNAYGIANLQHFGSANRSSFNSNSRIKQTSKDMYFEEIDTDVGSNASAVIATKVGCNTLFNAMLRLLFNKDGDLWRSANLLQVLGSMTALCCVDKKGILSWPNPVTDKVFFLTTPQQKTFSDASEPSNLLISDADEISDVSGDEPRQRRKRQSRKSRSIGRPEVLDVTHDPHNVMGLQFDDPDWYRFMSNLKPLGMAILLNTCNSEIQEEYTQFCDHISCESLHNEAAVPVVNKRCLCQLARQIGFTDSAVRDYHYLFQVGMFRHVKPEVIQQGKLARSLNIPRLKMPFPHMASAVIKESFTNTYQLFSQGTGDLMLDACTEYWDGSDLRILSDIDRKRILDFYHRTSLTAYSMAFSYVPLADCPDRHLHDHYLELPPDSSLFNNTKKLDSNSRAQRRGDKSDVNLSVNGRMDHSLSTDSLTVKEKDARDAHSSLSSQSCEEVNVEAISAQLNNEVFVGMVTMQYQACPDFVHLIEQLDKACIRFVHFSKENELRSRVFSEKMGLESGWNCHISLLSDNPKNENSCQPTSYSAKGSKSSLNEQSINLHPSLLRCQSAPSSVNLDSTVVKFVEGDTVVDIACDEDTSSQGKLSMASSSSSDSEKIDSSRDHLNKARQENISPSPSRITESTGGTGTEAQTAPFSFDIHNRAKLPKGIENIRPHLEEVDNVPLLVSLFTDCTPETSTEMIAIMQEYGEVVCVLGSSANMHNMPIFLQADASISIEPLYPELCVTQDVIDIDSNLESRVSEDFLTPTELAKLLNSLPCSLQFHREDNVSMHRLVMEARHYMINVRNSLQFFLCCCLSLSLAQLMTSIMFLPPLLSSGHVLWLVCVILPILSFSLMGTPCDPRVMTIATGKNLNLDTESIYYFLGCYLIKFSPPILVVVTCFALLVNFSCENEAIQQGTPGPCWMFIDIIETKKDFQWSSHLILSQTFVALLLVVYFIAISIGFVHRQHLIWQRNPLMNLWWISSCVGLFGAHVVFCYAEISYFMPSPASPHTVLFAAIPLPLVIFFGIICPFVLVAINSLVKRHEIKIYSRQQRRARLDFNTKLGMNSPF